MKKTFKCKHCGKRYRLNPRLKGRQKYCGSPVCQQVRKNAWERYRIKTNRDYKSKRHVSKANWRKHHQDEYQRQYRKTHPEYEKMNREKQRIRNESASGHQIVKTDTLNSERLVSPGLYALIPYNIVKDEKIVKTDVLIVQLANIQSNTAHFLNKSP